MGRTNSPQAPQRTQTTPGFTFSLPSNPGTSEPAQHLPDSSFLRSRWLFPEDQTKPGEPGTEPAQEMGCSDVKEHTCPCVPGPPGQPEASGHRRQSPPCHPGPVASVCLPGRTWHKSSASTEPPGRRAAPGTPGWPSPELPASPTEAGRAPAKQPINRPRLVSGSWNLITSYLWKIWNELGVPEGLVVSHVGIETSCVYQEGLNRTQTRRRVG